MRTFHSHLRRKAILPLALVGALIAALLIACGTKPSAPIPSPVDVPVLVTPPEPVAPPVPPPVPVIEKKISQARTAKEYRKDAASHLYALNQNRLYPGKLPPLLHAVGVLQVEIDPRGNVTGISWMRAPRHAPDVMAEIERSVRQAAPFPLPVRMGKVTYTDTWLWHSSGRFQLDTLTEGQL
ncbi:MAG: hypothetical protein CFE43_04845 [Burkholderiales bacterium PBB3]|nr:MAG: hypothetical protein CFE43_04845 [Burkholderiales bacterium PBB3]